MSPEWSASFEQFAIDVAPSYIAHFDMHNGDTSMDRADNNKGYAKGNTRWATRKEQANNKRSNRQLAAFGKVKSLVSWAEEYGMTPQLLWNRVYGHGWQVERALEQPVGRPKSHMFEGKAYSIRGLATKFGVPYHTFYRRITDFGMSIEEASRKGDLRYKTA